MGVTNSSPDLSGPAPQNRKPVVMVKVPPQPKHLQRKNTVPTSTDGEVKVLKRKRPEASKRAYSDLWSLREIQPRPLPDAQAAPSPDGSLGLADHNHQPALWPPPNAARKKAWNHPTVEDEHITQNPILTPNGPGQNEAK
jgi:hypothetical protein